MGGAQWVRSLSCRSSSVTATPTSQLSVSLLDIKSPLRRRNEHREHWTLVGRGLSRSAWNLASQLEVGHWLELDSLAALANMRIGPQRRVHPSWRRCRHPAELEASGRWLWGLEQTGTDRLAASSPAIFRGASFRSSSSSSFKVCVGILGSGRSRFWGPTVEEDLCAFFSLRAKLALCHPTGRCTVERSLPSPLAGPDTERRPAAGGILCRNRSRESNTIRGARAATCAPLSADHFGAQCAQRTDNLRLATALL